MPCASTVFFLEGEEEEEEEEEEAVAGELETDLVLSLSAKRLLELKTKQRWRLG